jgi:hypothetical protein
LIIRLIIQQHRPALTLPPGAGPCHHNGLWALRRRRPLCLLPLRVSPANTEENMSKLSSSLLRTEAERWKWHG